MSLIESAMAKERAARQQSSPTTSSPAGGGGRVSSAAAAPRPNVAPVPIEPIVAHPTAPDLQACQRNRILIDERGELPAVAAYRMLRTRLLQRVRARQWTTIGITSATAGDGKSVCSLNLALSVARERNSDTVLLDLDMRKPALCRYLGLQPDSHLRDFFERRISVEDLFFTIGVERLWIAAGSSATDTSSELLATSQLDLLLRYIRQHTVNPLILLDLPPVLQSDDALVVAPKVDAMLVVVNEAHTDREAVHKAVDLLHEFPLAGLVLNRAVETGQNYGYGYSVAGR